MTPFAGTRAGERRTGCNARLVQAHHQIPRQKRTVAWRARQPFDVRRICRGPVEPGEDAGEGPGETRHIVGDDGQMAIGKTRRVAVGVDDQPVALRRQALLNALENSAASDANTRFVAAAHAARQSAGEHKAESRRTAHARFFSLIAHRGLAAMLGAFFFDISEVLVEHDAAFTRERDEALAAGAADQRQIRLARKLDAPSGEARA
jgi:hypothetical protein